MKTNLTVRDAIEADLQAVLAIYNEVIVSSTAVYSLEPSTLEERQNWFRSRSAMGFPVVVAVNAEDDVVGFASFGEWRGAWPGYRYTVEHTVHVRHDMRGLGAGRALIETLLPRAQAAGKHVMIGGIDAANDASIRFHQRLGFEPVAHFREVGHKFGRWLDLIFMQHFLDAPGGRRLRAGSRDCARDCQDRVGAATNSAASACCPLQSGAVWSRTSAVASKRTGARWCRSRSVGHLGRGTECVD